MTAWRAVWGPGPGWMRWELAIVSDNGDVAMRVRSVALYAAPRPGDGLLEAMGMWPQQGKAWEEGPRGWYSCPLVVTAGAHHRLLTGLLAAGRSGPRGVRPPAAADESSLRWRVPGTTGG